MKTLETVADITSYIADGAKRHGGKNKFLSSEEYREAYPIIERIYADETATQRTHNKAAADTAMSEAGVSYGDRVTYTIAGMFFSTETVTGTIVNRGGFAMVKLDEKHNGKRHVKWHKGWRLVR